MATLKAYFFKGRRTAVFAYSKAEAIKKKKRPATDELELSRPATQEEREAYRKGNWIRNYHTPGTRAPRNKRGLGPKPK